MTLLVGRDVPEVPECYGYADTAAARVLHPDLTCPQCDGSHTHSWVRCEVVTGAGPEIVSRCRQCGARKCDVPNCLGRRHHRDPHVLTSGKVYGVGT